LWKPGRAHDALWSFRSRPPRPPFRGRAQAALVRPAGLALSKTPAWVPTLFPPYDAPVSLSGVVFVGGPRRSPSLISYIFTKRFDCFTSRLQNVDRLQSAAGVLRRHSHDRPGVSARPARSATDCNTRTTLRRCRRCSARADPALPTGLKRSSQRPCRMQCGQ
jgi:hypothetical protein